MQLERLERLRRGNGRCRYGSLSSTTLHSPIAVPYLAQLQVDLPPHIALLSFEFELRFVDTFLLFLLRLCRKR